MQQFITSIIKGVSTNMCQRSCGDSLTENKMKSFYQHGTENACSQRYRVLVYQKNLFFIFISYISEYNSFKFGSHPTMTEVCENTIIRFREMDKVLHFFDSYPI